MIKNTLKAMFEPQNHLLPSPLFIAKDRVRNGSQGELELIVELVLKVVEVEDDIEVVVNPSEPEEYEENFDDELVELSLGKPSLFAFLLRFNFFACKNIRCARNVFIN